MEVFKTKQRIGNGLYIIAIVLMLVGVFQRGRGVEDKFMELSGWIAFATAVIYSLWLSTAKKKHEQNSGNMDH